MRSSISAVERRSDLGSRASLMMRLRSSDSNIIAQVTRFALAGGLVLVVYLGTTTLLASVFGVPFQIALIIGFGLGLTLHFTLQRVFVWSHHEEFALPLHHQLGRYLALAATQYAVTAASTSLLPSRLGLSTEVVYLATAAVVTSVNFLLFRTRIFHPKAAATHDEPTLRAHE